MTVMTLDSWVAESVLIPPVIDEDSKRIEDLKVAISRTQTHVSSLYGFEKAAGEELLANLKPLQQELSVLETRMTLRPYEGYRQLSLEPLKWRRPDGWPVFMVMSLETDTMMFRFDDGYSFAITPNLPDVLQNQYRDIRDRLRKMVGDRFRKDVSLQARHLGLMPEETKVKLQAAVKTGLFGKKDNSLIFIIAEAPDWQLNVTPKPRTSDPILAGFAQGHLWLIDVYDPTPAELYFVKEFAV